MKTNQTIVKLYTLLMETCKWFLNIRIWTPTLVSKNPRIQVVSPWPHTKSKSIQPVLKEVQAQIPSFPEFFTIPTYYCSRAQLHHYDSTDHRLFYQRFRHLRNYFTMELIQNKFFPTKKSQTLEIKLAYDKSTLPARQKNKFHTKDIAFLESLLDLEGRDELLWCLKTPFDHWNRSIKVHYTQARLMFLQSWFPKHTIILEQQNATTPRGKDRQYILEKDLEKYRELAQITYTNLMRFVLEPKFLKKCTIAYQAYETHS